jgi:MFS family permease
MADTHQEASAVNKFAGIEVPPELNKMNFFFLYVLTFVIGMFMSVPAVIQPAFLKEIIAIDQNFSGSINSFLQNMSQIATLLFVAVIGALSDKTGRKILAFFSFVLLAVSFYFFGMAQAIAEALNIPAAGAAKMCAAVSFVPSKAAAFEPFAPGLLVTYLMRFVIGIGLVLGYPQFITMVADYTCEKDRGKGMAFNGMAMGLASILVFGIFGAIVKNAGVVAAINTGAFVAGGAAVLTWFFLKDRMPDNPDKKGGLLDVLPAVKKSPTLKASYFCSLVTRADIVVLATYLVAWGVKSAEQFGMDSGDATMKATIPLIMMGVLSFAAFPVIGILLDKWGRVPTILLSLVAAAAGMLIIAISSNAFSPLIYVAVVFASFGMSGAIAGANTMASDVSPKGILGAVLGGLNTMQPIGILFFLAVGGYLFDTFGAGWAFAIKGIANLVLFAGIVLFQKPITEEINSTAAKRAEAS